MKDVTIYMTKYCGYCSAAKSLLKKKGATPKEVDVAMNPTMRDEISKKFNWPTVPMIVIGDEFIGGFQELNALERQGELEKRLR